MLPLGNNSSQLKAKAASLQHDQWYWSRFLTFTPLCGPSYTVSALACVTSRVRQMWCMSLLRLGHKRHCGGCLVLSLITKSGSCWVPRWGHSGSPMERPAWWETEASCQQACDWTILKANPLAPIKPAAPTHIPTVASAKLSEFLIHRHCEITNVCCFKPLSSEVICHSNR